MNKNHVSVVIPAFNQSAMLREAIARVLAQTCGRVEVVVIDDGSTDDTRAVVEQSGSALVYHRKANDGTASARNFGMRVARGGLVALLDQDDRWLPEKNVVDGDVAARIIRVSRKEIRANACAQYNCLARAATGPLSAACLRVRAMATNPVQAAAAVFRRAWPASRSGRAN